MSQLKLTADSGGGTVAIKGPASTTGNGAIELTVPGTGNATLLTSATSTGKILQVLTNTTQNSTGSVSLSSSRIYYDVPDQNITITPSSNTSKILISFQQLGEFSSSANAFNFALERGISGGATTTIQGDISGNTNQSAVFTSPLTTYWSDDNDTTLEIAHCSNYLDSPATASAVTYKIKVRKHEAGSSTYYYNRTVRDDNQNHSEKGLSWITVMEIAA